MIAYLIIFLSVSFIISLFIGLDWLAYRDYDAGVKLKILSIRRRNNKRLNLDENDIDTHISDSTLKEFKEDYIMNTVKDNY